MQKIILVVTTIIAMNNAVITATAQESNPQHCIKLKKIADNPNTSAKTRAKIQKACPKKFAKK